MKSSIVLLVPSFINSKNRVFEPNTARLSACKHARIGTVQHSLFSLACLAAFLKHTYERKERLSFSADVLVLKLIFGTKTGIIGTKNINFGTNNSLK
jgi:hypothetical protein